MLVMSKQVKVTETAYKDGFGTSGRASRPKGGGNSTSPQLSLHRYSAVESSLAARSNMWTFPSDTTMSKSDHVTSCDIRELT